MYFRWGKVTRGVIGAPSNSGLWLGPARVIMTEAIQQWNGSVHSTTGQIGVVWLSRGGLVQVSMPTSVTELTNALSSWTIRRFVD